MLSVVWAYLLKYITVTEVVPQKLRLSIPDEFSNWTWKRKCHILISKRSKYLVSMTAM